MVKKLLTTIMILCMSTCIAAQSIKFDLGGTLDKDPRSYSVKNALTIQPTFGKDNKHTPFFDWKHKRIETDNAVVDYSYGFGYIYSIKNKHSFKSQNFYQFGRDEWDFKIGYETSWIKKGRLSTEIVKIDSTRKDSIDVLRYYKFGIEEGASYSMMPDDNTTLVHIGGNVLFVTHKLNYTQKETDQVNPLRLIFNAKSNFGDRPLELLAKIRIEYKGLFVEPIYEIWFDNDFDNIDDYEIIFGYTGGL